MTVHEIPGVVVVEWNDEVKSMFDTWSSYRIKVEEFRDAILEKCVSYAKAHGAKAWVMDASNVKAGAFSPEVQKLIEAEVFKKFVSIGIKYFVTIKSSSTITNMSIKNFTSHLGPNGIQMVEVPNKTKAIEWLKEQVLVSR